MSQSQQSWFPKKKYVKVDYAVRMKLIQLVEDQGKKIIQAAIDLNVKYCTAKAIIKKYRQSGAVTVSKAEKGKIIQKSPEIDHQHQIQTIVVPNIAQNQKKSGQSNRIRFQQQNREFHGINSSGQNHLRQSQQVKSQQQNENIGTNISITNNNSPLISSEEILEFWKFHFHLTCNFNFANGHYDLF